ncbi:Integrase family protein [Mesorhizobium sp. ORS 3359]|nr:Integrase family protein [Mesorhizobium sp. ORS 3359]
MARTLIESPVTTRNARAALEVGVHWRGIDPDVHLGYRKGKRGGTWLVRWRSGRGYKQETLGTADDEMQTGTLSYEAARKAARSVVEAVRTEAAAAAGGALLTVREAVETYVNARDSREAKREGRPVRSDANRRLARYVLGQPVRRKRDAIPEAPIASTYLHALTEADLTTWRNGLPASLKATTRQRLINDLKAALNGAYAANRNRLDPMVPAIIKHGLKAAAHEEQVPVARDNQILSDAAVAQLLKAVRAVDAEQEWDGDLFRLVVVLTATGARFSQVIRMAVADCQSSAGRLLVPVSRKGRGVKAGSVPVPVGRDVLEALIPATLGRADDARLLERWHQRQLPGSIKWERVERGPWRSASELARPWQAIRAAAKLPDVIPYALRHSSIVRGIRANLPIRLVAALHDTSVPMIERHYGRWIADGLEDMAARAVVPIVPADESSPHVIPIRRV